MSENTSEPGTATSATWSSPDAQTWTPEGVAALLRLCDDVDQDPYEHSVSTHVIRALLRGDQP